MIKIAMSIDGDRFEAEGDVSLVLEKFDQWVHQLRRRGKWWVVQDDEPPAPQRPKRRRASKKSSQVRAKT